MISDAEILEALAEMPRPGRATLRKYLIAHSMTGTDSCSSSTATGQEVSALPPGFRVEVLSADDDARRRVTRIFGEIEAANH